MIDRDVEYWDLYDKKGKYKRRVIRKGMSLGKNDYHLITEAWILRSDGRFVIQRRALNKHSFPGMWYCSAGGSVLAKETPKEGIIREIREELGVNVVEEELSLRFIITESNAIFYVFLVKKDVELEEVTLQQSEVMDVKLASIPMIRRMIVQGEFIPLEYYERFFRNVEKNEKTDTI